MYRICRRSAMLLLIALLVLRPAYAETGQSTRVTDPKQHAQKRPGGYPHRQHVDYVLKELDLRPGDVVVYIGAGDGWWSERMAKAVGPEGTIHAAEVEQKLVDKMKQKHAGVAQIKPYLCKTDNLELAENSCDLAFLSYTYHHLKREGRVEYLQRLRKIVKPTGRFCVCEKYSEIALESKDHGMQLSRVLQDCEEAGWIPVRCELLTGTQTFMAIFVQKDLFPAEKEPAKKPGT